MEKRILALHLDLSRFHIFLNQNRPGSNGNLNDLSVAKGFPVLGTCPYMGENLSLTLWETKNFPAILEKTLSPFSEN